MQSIMEAVALFNKGGLVMYALLFCSVFAVTIAVERYLYFKSCDSGALFADEACRFLKKGDFNGAEELSHKTGGANARILFSALQLRRFGAGYLEKYLESEASITVADLRRRIPYLGIIVTMSPLLGLLGTVVGMISSFNVFAAQTGQPHAITGGVGEALIATASGLVVALVALVAHSYFAQKIDTMLTDMEKTYSVLIEALYRSES